MLRILYFFLWVLSIICLQISCKDVGIKEVTNNEDKKHSKLNKFPKIYLGTWVNEGMRMRIKFEDNGTVKFHENTLPNGIKRLKGKWKVSNDILQITWNKKLYGHKIIEYKFRQTENQELLIPINMSKGPPYFYRAREYIKELNK